MHLSRGGQARVASATPLTTQLSLEAERVVAGWVGLSAWTFSADLHSVLQLVWTGWKFL